MNQFVSPKRLNIKNKILYLLKMSGQQTAAELAKKLQVSPMAIRQHLQTLQTEQWVTYLEERQLVGRPVKLWQLSGEAMSLFPNHHADLAIKLIEGISQVFGLDGLAELIAERTQAQIQSYTSHLSAEWGWRKRVDALVELRSQEGYMAEIIESSDNTLLLVENHCSICTAARRCPSLCHSELQVFTALLGSAVTIERIEHILSGDRRCTYVVSET